MDEGCRIHDISRSLTVGRTASKSFSADAISASVRAIDRIQHGVEARGKHALHLRQEPGFATQAALFMVDNTSTTVSPKDDGVGTIVTPAPFRISTFSWADSPKAEMIAPA